MTSLLHRTVQILKFLVPAVIAFFIGRTIYRNWREVREANWAFDGGYLLLSILLTVGWFALRPYVWAAILGRFGHPIRYGAAFRIFRQAELSRYVPGAVWQYVSRVYLASRWGVPAAATMAATIVETVLLILASILPALLNIREALPRLEGIQQVLLFAFPVVALVVVHPRVLNLWAGFLARRMQQPYTELRIGWGSLAGVWFTYSVMWLVVGLGVGLFVRGVISIPLNDVPRVGSYYAAAWFIGIVSVVAPAGMGIREGAFGLLLAQAMPLGAALTIAVGVRLWMTLLELLWAGVGLWFFDAPSPHFSPPEDRSAS
jgi:hypothetical protein